MTQSHPKFTIIIPTRERAAVLDAALRTACAQDCDNLEIIVSDNFSTDETREVVAGHRDPRIRYINTGRRLSMSHNWEFALAHVEDGWVTMLGDDDGMLPGAISKVRELAEMTGVAAIRSDCCSYNWPSVLERNHGRLEVTLRSGHEIRNPREWLSKVLAGRQNYSALPMLYNGGFVEYRLIESIRSRTGAFYHSMIPDVYSAVVFSRVLDRYAYTFEPLAINGASSHSGGTSAFARGGLNSSGSTPSKQFLSEPNIPFHSDLPLPAGGGYPLSVDALVYESLLQSERLGESGIPHVTHESQLEVILRNADGQNRQSVIEWGRLFAERHGLPFDKVLERSRFRRPLDRICGAFSRFSSGFNTVVIGSEQLPVRNVYEASVAAATVRSIAPGRIGNFARRVRDKLGTGAG